MSQIDWKNVETLVKYLYMLPLYTVGNTQLADNDWWNKQIKHSHTYKYTHI